jgi:preprotein translocase subunit Sss1
MMKTIKILAMGVLLLGLVGLVVDQLLVEFVVYSFQLVI